MTSELSNREPQDAAVAGAASDEPVVNLQIVSPSVGVTRALMFPGLPATTTIKQLKDKIRDTLPLKPAGENQRLIYRGRAILRETDTLLDIFGADTVSFCHCLKRPTLYSCPLTSLTHHSFALQTNKQCIWSSEIQQIANPLPRQLAQPAPRVQLPMPRGRISIHPSLDPHLLA